MKKSERIETQNTKGILSLVFGILGILLVFFAFIGIIFSILAIFFYRQEKKEGRSSSLGRAGMVLGIIGLVINLLAIFLIALALALFSFLFIASDEYTFEEYPPLQNHYEEIEIIQTEKTKIQDIPRQEGSFIETHEIDGKIFNIEFNSPKWVLENLSYPIEFSFEEISKTENITLVFKDYIGQDNGQVSIASIKLTRFLTNALNFEFGDDSFARYSEKNCSNSSPEHRMMIFNPYSDTNGMFISENGCILVNTDEPWKMMRVIDSFLYSYVQGSL